MISNKKRIWPALAISAVPEAAEAIEFAFNSLDSLGTEIDDLTIRPNDIVTVIGYFDTLPDDVAIQNELNYALSIYGLTKDAILAIDRREIEDADWLLKWKQHWKPTEIGRFVIAPPWEHVDAEKIAIKIEPNMAFGTGTHETTQLCLKAIDENYLLGQSFLDVGTGTGILAIAAAKFMSKAKISACDLDADSVAIAKDNAALNGVAGRIEFYVGSITADTPQFDFVCANLTLDVILPILPLLLEKTKKTLVLSGILNEQEETIVSSLKDSQMSDFRVEYSGEWISVALSIVY